MLFPSIAHAMGPAPGGDASANPIMSFAPLIIMFAIFYFLLIRPQQKKAKEHKTFLDNLKRGDYIMTGGGFYGRVLEIKDDVVTVELSEGMEVKVNRSFISGSGEAAKENGKAKKNKDEK